MADLKPLISRGGPGVLGSIDSLLPPDTLPGFYPTPTGEPIGGSISPPDLSPLTHAAMGGGLKSLLSVPAPIAPSASDPLMTRKSQDEADLYRRNNPSSPSTTLGKIGHVAARVGNVLGNIFAPATMTLIPGTELNNEARKSQDKNDISTVSDLQTAEAGRAQQAAQTAYTTARPAIEQAKILQKLTSSLAPKGIIATMNPDGTIDTQDDPDSQAFKNQQALSSWHTGQTAFDAIKAENADQKYKPGTPQYAEWKQRLDNQAQANQIHLAALGVSRERLGFDEDKNYNPQPTAAERGKGDLAQSAVDRVGEMKAIVAKHPEYFGPVAGREQNAQAWLGSSDPDAVTYNTAAQYLADHSAGVFGGRGQYITQALHSITDPKYTPEGLNAALDEAGKAAQGFVTAGTTHGKGQKGAAASFGTTPPPAAEQYQRVNGKLVKVTK